MQIRTSKDAHIAQAVLLALTGTTYKLRSIDALAKAAAASVYETQNVVNSMGLKSVRRRSDGKALYGIAGKVSGQDVVHVPVQNQAASTSEPRGGCCTSNTSASTGDRIADAKGKILVALQDTRWKYRSLSRLASITGLSEYDVKQILRDFDVKWEGGLVGLRNRACRY